MDETEYENIVKNCVKKDTPHIALEDDKSKWVYTITTIARSVRYGGERTPIVCSSFEYANEVVSNNSGDIWEHSYNLVVIESVMLDALYGSVHGHKYWYVWDYNPDEPGCGKYVPIEEPAYSKNTWGFVIG